jgi:hypothetical protein
MACTWKDIAGYGATLPGIVEGTSYGTPALRVGKAFLTRYRPEDDSIVIKLPVEEREMRIEAAPAIYFITDHYRAYPAVLVRLANLSKAEMRAILERGWAETAPRKLRALRNI